MISLYQQRRYLGNKIEELNYRLNKINMKLYIKYMVSLRCKMLVKEELERLEIPFGCIELGTVELLEEISISQRNELEINLLSCGLRLHKDKKMILIEKIKNTILEMIQYDDGCPTMNYSEYISEKLNYDYTYLANIFSEVKGITIQQYIILNKIEGVKELLLFDELNLTEISYKLNYSSVAHLSGQFNKVTGYSPSIYKEMKRKREETLEIA